MKTVSLQYAVINFQSTMTNNDQLFPADYQTLMANS